MKRLPVLCPQEYDGACDMRVTVCEHCHSGWDKRTQACTIATGAEHLPDVVKTEIPRCPIEDRCQHQLQVVPAPCLVRSKGLICESALIFAAVPDALNHDLSFNASTIATAEDLESR